jgi:hypothetical protein
LALRNHLTRECARPRSPAAVAASPAVYDWRGVFEVVDESCGSGILPRNASVECVELLGQRYERVHAANTRGPVIIDGCELLREFRSHPYPNLLDTLGDHPNRLSIVGL